MIMPPPTAASATAQRAEVQPGRWLDARCALWLEAERLLVIADLHWGYAASHRARGHLLPDWGDDAIEQRLRALMADYQPAEMLWLGDIVHAAEGAARAERFLRDAPVRVTLLAGNHDRRWRGVVERTRQSASYVFHHGDEAIAIPSGCVEIVGHHHPALGWSDGAGGRIKLPALIAGPRRLILPAFSPWAAGTPWNQRLEPGETLWAISPARIFACPRAAASAGRAP